MTPPPNIHITTITNIHFPQKVLIALQFLTSSYLWRLLTVILCQFSSAIVSLHSNSSTVWVKDERKMKRGSSLTRGMTVQKSHKGSESPTELLSLGKSPELALGILQLCIYVQVGLEYTR